MSSLFKTTIRREASPAVVGNAVVNATIAIPEQGRPIRQAGGSIR